tara:strand:+ start:21285 stop:21965 length:681 start_codon:yes stop_codon:yes gene_type:complete
MYLDQHYENLWAEALLKFHQKKIEKDPLIDSKFDKRRGITLLIRPNEFVKKAISKCIAELHKIDPNQYYYPLLDIHITVMSIISCYDGFDLNKITISEYNRLINLSLKDIEKTQIQFKGITASDSCIMLKGFPQNDTLEAIRNKLRASFANTDLENSMDKRYKIMTAHSTIVRFKSDIKKHEDFFEIIEKYRDFDFGTFEVANYELVFNDWYQKKENTKLLAEFKV